MVEKQCTELHEKLEDPKIRLAGNEAQMTLNISDVSGPHTVPGVLLLASWGSLIIFVYYCAVLKTLISGNKYHACVHADGRVS